MNTKLLKLQKDINSLEFEKDKIIKKIINDSKMTIQKWKEILDKEEFDKAIDNLFVSVVLPQTGSRYFPYKSEERKKAFDNFFKLHGNTKKKYHYCYTTGRFFTIFKNRDVNFMVRSTNEKLETKIVNNCIKYSYTVENYCGFKILVNSAYQKFSLELETNKIIYYKSSDERHDQKLFSKSTS